MRRLFVAAFVAALIGVPSLAASPGAAATPGCLVSNERSSVGLRSLAESVAAAEPGDTLVVKGTCQGGDIWIEKDLHLKGVSNPAFGAATISGTEHQQTLLVTSNEPWGGPRVSVEIEALTIEGGYWVFGGAGIYTSYATLTLNDTTVTGGAGALGGGLYIFSSTLVLNDSSISGNIAANGGGLFASRGTVTLNHSTITGNRAQDTEFVSGPNEGGGIVAMNTVISLNDSTVTGNHADDRGGGIFDWDGTSTLINCIEGVNVFANTPDDIYRASS